MIKVYDLKDNTEYEIIIYINKEKLIKEGEEYVLFRNENVEPIQRKEYSSCPCCAKCELTHPGLLKKEVEKMLGFLNEFVLIYAKCEPCYFHGAVTNAGPTQTGVDWVGGPKENKNDY